VKVEEAVIACARAAWRAEGGESGTAGSRLPDGDTYSNLDRQGSACPSSEASLCNKPTTGWDAFLRAEAPQRRVSFGLGSQ
jgi:hypothetical protein